MTDKSYLKGKKSFSRSSTEVKAYIAKVEKYKQDAEVVTLREWNDSTKYHQVEVVAYMEKCQ